MNDTHTLGGASVHPAPTSGVPASPANQAVTTLTIAADGVSGITDQRYDHLFRGESAREGLAALISAGRVTVNGATVPTASTGDADRHDINGGRGLWRDPDGTWSWDAHVLWRGANESFESASLNFVNALTKLRGLDYRLELTDGLASALDVTVFDVAFANTVTVGIRHTRITTVGSGDNSTDKPNPSTISFPNANVLGAPESQSMVLYWHDRAGWHLQRAASNAVVLDVSVSETGTVSGTIDGAPIVDSRLTLQYSQEWNRPAQPVRAIAWMGGTTANLIQWMGVGGVTVGFSRGAGAREALDAAIATSTAALQGIEVSAAGDGSDIAAGRMWVTQEYHDIFARAIADARAASVADLTGAEYEGALYRLAQAFGGETGDRLSRLENRYFGKGDDYGRGAAFDTGHDGTGFRTFAVRHLR